MMDNSPLVLIVEDHAFNRKLFRDLLHSRKVRTLEAEDGVTAVEYAVKHHPDLILLDIQLPQMSGVEVVKWIKGEETLSEIPIVAVTAYAMKEDESVLLASGCDAYLSKPIAISTFIKTVENFLKP